LIVAQRREALQQIAKLRIQMAHPDEIIAEQLGVSPRTLRSWMRTEEYREVVDELREELRQAARLRMVGMADQVVSTLYDLMLNARSGLVQLQAAQTLGQWIDLPDVRREDQLDDRTEVTELLKKIAERPVTAPQIIIMPPGPGGRLPGRPDDSDANDAVRALPAPREAEEASWAPADETPPLDPLETAESPPDG
jgi:hypothetical protein